MVDKIINFNDYTVNWKEVEKIPEFAKLKDTQQTPIWHGEGVCWNHTQLVVEHMYKLVPYNGRNSKYRLIMVLGALFHDIGKGEVTLFSEEKQDWSSPNHDICGEEITNRLLIDEHPVLRDSVCYLVRNHMKPLGISESETQIRDIITLSCCNNNLDMCTNENLIILKTADCMGSIMQYDDNWQGKLKYMSILCQKNNCYDRPYKFLNEYSRKLFLEDLTIITP